MRVYLLQLRNAAEIKNVASLNVVSRSKWMELVIEWTYVKYDNLVTSHLITSVVISQNYRK